MVTNFKRRKFIASARIVGVAGLAGCSSGGDTSEDGSSVDAGQTEIVADDSDGERSAQRLT